MGLEALRAWASDKHLLLAIYAQQAATSAESCFELCKLVQSERLFDLVKEDVAPSGWLKFYRGRVNVLEKVLEAHNKIEPVSGKFANAYEKAYAGWTKESGKFIIGAKKNRDVEARLWKEIEEFHYKNLTTEWDADISEEFIRLNPAVAFTFRVSIPSQLIWGCTATTLYRQARLGDPASIGRLLRIDPIAIEDAQIRRKKLEILKAGGNGTKVLRREMNQDTSRLITLGNMKVLLAANVIKLSKAMERDLNEIAKRTPGMKVGRIRFEEPEMRSLFDAVSRDFRNQEIDMDIPESPEAFAKALQRAQRFWPDY